MPDRPLQRVLVTGGAGFLGSHLVRSYLAGGISVRAVGHRPKGSPETQGAIPDGGEFLELELCDARQLQGAFERQDLVIHTAAVTRAHGPEGRRLQERVNVEATRNTIEACRRGGVPRLLHVSTTAAIGISPDRDVPADENFSFNLDHLGLSYNTSKHQAERLVLEANDSALETMVVNPGFVFGRHHRRYNGEEVIARVLRSSVVVCTDGGLSVVHVDDVVEGVRSVAENGRAGERYILSGDNCSFRTIADAVCKVAGIRKTVLSVPKVVRDVSGLLLNSLARAKGLGPDLYLDRRYAYQFYSSEKARLELGYRPRSFETIVADYLGLTGGRGA